MEFSVVLNLAANILILLRTNKTIVAKLHFKTLKYRNAMNVAFLASFGHKQKNLSYLTVNFSKQGYMVLFFPYPAATMFRGL